MTGMTGTGTGPESPGARPPLPALPDRSAYCDGDGWIEALPGAAGGGWYWVPVWGTQPSWLGRPPLVNVAHYDGAGVYGQAIYTEGDLEVTAFTDRTSRDAATARVAAYWWRTDGTGPDGLPVLLRDEDIPQQYRQPYQSPPARRTQD